jgi:hypothetical protein
VVQSTKEDGKLDKDNYQNKMKNPTSQFRKENQQKVTILEESNLILEAEVKNSKLDVSSAMNLDIGHLIVLRILLPYEGVHT